MIKDRNDNDLRSRRDTKEAARILRRTLVQRVRHNLVTEHQPRLHNMIFEAGYF